MTGVEEDGNWMGTRRNDKGARCWRRFGSEIAVCWEWEEWRVIPLTEVE